MAHCGGESVSRCPANTELFCRSSGRQTSFDEFLHHRNRLGIHRRAPGCSTASFRCGDAVAGKDAIAKARAVVAALTGIAPGDVIEDMAAAQLFAAYQATMDCYRRAAVPDQPLEVVRECLNQANRTSRTWAALVEALNRHRGKSGQQTVRVEHVTVADGGQAVIGPVATGGGGER